MNDKKFAFATDIHGNLDNVDRFLSEAAIRNTDYVIFGGDIAPKKVAVQSSDDKALVLNGSGSYNSIYNFSLLENDASKAYRNGYVLLPEDLSANELQHLYEVFGKLEKHIIQTGKYKKNICTWQLADFDLLETVFLRFFVEHIKSDEHSSKLYNVLLKKLLKSHISDLSPEKLWKSFINNQKLSFLYQNKVSIQSPQAARLFHLDEENYDQGELKEIITCAIFMKDLYNSLIESFSKSCKHYTKWIDVMENANLHTLEGQKKSIRDLIQRIAQFQNQTKANVITLLGNDDHKELRYEFLRAEKQGILKHAGNRVVQIDDVQVLGYSNVLPLPFSFDIWYKNEAEIARDLQKLKRQIRDEVRFTVFNIHMPPSGTSLAFGKIQSDEIEDWGSDAVRDSILETQPSHVFTGHLHESWMISGKIQDRIGESYVYNPGASEITPRLLYGDLNDPDNVELIT